MGNTNQTQESANWQYTYDKTPPSAGGGGLSAQEYQDFYSQSKPNLETTIPQYFLFQTKIKTQQEFQEIEKIWETYKALLSQGSLAIVKCGWYIYNTEKYHSVTDSLVDIQKLHSIGKNYLDQNEIDKIVEGSIKDYLARFTHVSAYQDVKEQARLSINLSMKNKNKSMAITPINYSNKPFNVPRSTSQSQTILKQGTFSPDSPKSEIHYDFRSQDNSEFSNENFNENNIQYDSTCQQASGYCSSGLCENKSQQINNLLRHQPKVQQQTCYLEFLDFFQLMKLKIWFQHQQVSEVIEQQHQRLSHVSSSQKKRGIRKANDGKTMSNVTVETKQESVSCLLWPFEMSQNQKNSSNLTSEHEEELDFSMEFQRDQKDNQRASNHQREKTNLNIHKISEMPSQYEESTNEKNGFGMENVNWENKMSFQNSTGEKQNLVYNKRRFNSAQRQNNSEKNLHYKNKMSGISQKYLNYVDSSSSDQYEKNYNMENSYSQSQDQN